MAAARTTVALTGRERFFGEEEIIFSKTDVSGKITYTNAVFRKVSDYNKDELLGAPHSVIRHPEMPRALFKYAWERLLAGHEVFAYVNNMTKHGDNYWVLAHRTPSTGRAARSSASTRIAACRTVARSRKSSRFIARFSPKNSGTTTARGLSSSYELLLSTLNGAGRSYDEWIWTL
jgi:PAS domain S-box-containing protein